MLIHYTIELLVPSVRIELAPPLRGQNFKSCVSTNSTIGAFIAESIVIETNPFYRTTCLAGSDNTPVALLSMVGIPCILRLLTKV